MGYFVSLNKVIVALLKAILKEQSVDAFLHIQVLDLA